MKLSSTTTRVVPSVMPAAGVLRSESGAGAASGASGMTAGATVVFGTGTESQGSVTAEIVPAARNLVATGAAARSPHPL